MAPRKNILIVYAHPEKSSFNAALLEVARSSLASQGHNVVVSDLYEMKFNPVISREDLKDASLRKQDYISLPAGFQAAFEKGQLADDIVVEQAKVRDADLIIFQFPLFWGGMPAIMKGWIDRVLCMGFAFTATEMYDNGKLKSKKAVLSLTTGGPGSFYTDAAIHGDINVHLWPIQNTILRLVGMNILSPQINHGVSLPIYDAAAREKMLADWGNRLKGIFQESCIEFIPSNQFKPVNPSNILDGLEVGPKLDKRGAAVDEGYNIGQHLGKKVPANSMTAPRP